MLSLFSEVTIKNMNFNELVHYADIFPGDSVLQRTLAERASQVCSNLEDAKEVAENEATQLDDALSLAKNTIETMVKKVREISGDLDEVVDQAETQLEFL